MTQEVSKVIDEILTKTGLDWEVETRPLYIKTEGTNYDIESGYIATMRKDNQEVFGVFKDYQIFQNSELTELAYRVAEKEGLTLKGGGNFKGGARVYLQLQNGDTNGIGKNKDTIENYITAINSFDGSTSLRWGYSNTVISCSNSFWAAYRKLDNAVRHTATMKDRVEIAVREIEHTRMIEHNMIDTFWKLAEIATTEASIRRVIKEVFKMDLSKINDAPTRTQNNILQMTECINTEQEEKGNTLWGLFNGVTKYTTHYAGTDGGREMSKVMGINNRIDNKVLTILTEMI